MQELSNTPGDSTAYILPFFAPSFNQQIARNRTAIFYEKKLDYFTFSVAFFSHSFTASSCMRGAINSYTFWW